MTIDEMKNKLQTVLKPKRYIHSINVMNTAIELAEKYNEDAHKAAIAGLLHDCAREIKGEAVFELCSKYSIKTDYVVMVQPDLLHGPIGSKIVPEEYGINDKAVLEAIRSHTTGCENMPLLSKIVFMADYIEPGRIFSGVNEVRNLAFKNIDDAMILALDRTVKFVIDRGFLVHSDTINARNSIVYQRMKNKGSA